MDEKQLQYEFLSILSESHPGLTFEEYRDSCVFLLFYQYLCLKHGDSLEEAYINAGGKADSVMDMQRKKNTLIFLLFLCYMKEFL